MNLRPYQSESIAAVYEHLRTRDDNGEFTNAIKGYAKKGGGAAPQRQASSGGPGSTPPWKR